MRSFAQPKNLARAGVAALLSTLACYPRLAIWDERGAPVALLLPILLWSLFVLWGFVFAWQFQYAHRRVFAVEFRPKLWAIVTAGAVVAAWLVHYTLDPNIRVVTPGSYPTNIKSWVAMGLFSLVFEPLFLTFAPFAFFIRLFRKQDVALALTVVFGLFVLALRIGSTTPSAALLIELVFLRAVAGFVSLYLYLQGGALLVWWAMLILHLRLLLDLR